MACKLAERRRRATFEGRQASRSRQGVVPVYRAGRGATVARLTRPESLRDEGERMRNCVGDYWVDVAEGDCAI